MKNVFIPSPEQLGERIGLSPAEVKIYRSDLEDIGVEIGAALISESDLREEFQKLQFFKERNFSLAEVKNGAEKERWSAVDNRLALQSESYFCIEFCYTLVNLIYKILM